MKKYLLVDTPLNPLSQAHKNLSRRGDFNSHAFIQRQTLKIIQALTPSAWLHARKREGAGGVWLFLLTLFIFSSLFSSAQNPLVKMWDKRFGALNDEWFESFQQTADGGYILGGFTDSNAGGDKTQNSWGYRDYWIVKTDSLGNNQWDKDFGGTQWDHFFSIQQTTDHGYILGGYSDSNISGDKTQNTKGYTDYWIVKIDSLGNKQWDRDFGGTDDDLLFSIQQTIDGGYILGGYSKSGISGDKTQANWDPSGNTYDYWIVKTDSLGNKQWDKIFGGTTHDWLRSIRQTADKGYILGGYSLSNISGDKTQNIWGGTSWCDYWIVKTDSLGNKQWDKDFGGTNDDELYSLQQTADGGFILGGWSASGISGDKTQPTWGSYDYWIVKTDSLGNKQWDKDFGGTNGEDEFGNITQTSDGGYLMAGISTSPISGDKTQANLGPQQTWVVRTDSLGNKQWDKTIFTPLGDVQGMAIQTRDGCYAFANRTEAAIGGYLTQPSRGGFDYWLIKFCDTTQVPLISFTAGSPLCPGTCTNFTNLSFNATSYQWNFFGASPDTSTAVNPQSICYANPGSYDVQLIATNANGSDTLLLTNYITVYPTPPPQSITQNGDTLFAIAGAGTYQWYFNTTIINGATNYFYVAPQSGDYNVVCMDANGCEVEAAVFNVVANSQSAADSPQSTVVYPNPVIEKLEIRNWKKGTAIDISIYNIIGEKVYTAVDCQLRTVDCGLLPSGLYWIEVSDGEKTFRTKFVKQ